MRSVKSENWNKLDNAAKIFPPTSNERDTKVFRFSCQLKEPVDGLLLQQALDDVIGKFPIFCSVLKRGMFWYYFETNVKGKPVVREEEDFPCRYIEQHRNKSYLFRVTYYKNRINLEVFHALADGMGAVNFLRELTYQYLRICYPQLSGEMGDRLCDDTSLDTEDSYLKNYKKAGKKTYKSVPAVHMKGERLVRGELGIIHGYMSVKQLKEKAKELGMSINEYLSGIFVYSIYKGYLHGNVSKKPIVLCVPVNLRPFFGSMTTRNFFAMASASFLPEKEKYERLEVMKLVQAELKRQITQENLEKMIAYNVSNQKNYALRVVPLFLKKPAIKFVYLMSAKATTTTLTNMGRMIVDEAYRPYIKRFQIILSPSTGQNTKATVCSYGDELTFTFSSLLKDTSVQKVFFRSLAEDGIDVEIETNGVYYD